MLAPILKAIKRKTKKAIRLSKRHINALKRYSTNTPVYTKKRRGKAVIIQHQDCNETLAIVRFIYSQWNTVNRVVIVSKNTEKELLDIQNTFPFIKLFSRPNKTFAEICDELQILLESKEFLFIENTHKYNLTTLGNFIS